MKERKLPPAEEQMIQSRLAAAQPDADELFGNVSRLLSRLSRHMGVVVSPHIVRVRLRDIEFVKLGPRRVLVIIVAASQMIHNKMIEIDEDLDQERLDRIGRYLTETFKDHTLPEIRDRILEMMNQEKTLYDTLLRDALKLGQASVENVETEEGTGRVFMDGTANLLAEPEFNSIDRLKGLFRTFEEKHELLRVLNSCLEQDAAGVRVLIGSENPSRQMSDCALVAATYGVPGATLGTLGIIGPTRMEYARAIALVDSVARLFSNSLARTQG
jgi:heat-inducible transcriptional repressor